MNLTIEFTGSATANDAEIREGCDRARQVIAAAGKTIEQAWAENQVSLETRMETSELWAKAEYAATAEMGEGSSLIAF